MKVKSNKISDILKYYTNFLIESFNENESKSLIRILFEEYTTYKSAELAINLDKAINESQLLKIHKAVKALKNNMPVQYIIGKASFYDIELFVDENVLIPRPETEELVEWILTDNSVDTKAKILDIGTGSGCIAVTLKKHLPEAKVAACDFSEKAIEIAKKNAENKNTDIDFHHWDILEVKNFSAKYDIIVSNPPYVMEKEKSLMQMNVLDYEPDTALFVPDSDPLLYYKAIADFAIKNLNTNGRLYLEINENLGEETMSLLKNRGFTNVILKKDINGKDRMICCLA